MSKIEKIYKLTPMQEGMYFHKMVDESATSYVLQTVIEIDGKIDSDAVKKSLDYLCGKYEVLRTAFVFPKTSATPLQAVLDDRRVEFNERWADLEQIESIKSSDIIRGFNLTKDSLLRVTLIHVNENSHIMLWSSHHIIMDGWCTTLVFRDFIDCYNQLKSGKIGSIDAKLSAEKGNTLAFGDYVAWLEKQNKARAYGYWDELLEGYDGAITVPKLDDGKRGEAKSCTRTMDMSKELTEKLDAVASRLHITVNTIAETAWGILLQKYNNTNDVVFGKVVSGRNAGLPNIESAVGLFINTVPVRVQGEHDIAVSELLTRAQTQAIDSIKYEYSSLTEIQSRSLSGKNLIQTLFVFENFYVDDSVTTDSIEGASFRITNSREEVNYAIALSAHRSDVLSFLVMYDNSQYSHTHAQRVLDNLKLLLEQIADTPDIKLNQLALADDVEKDIVLNKFNSSSSVRTEKTVIDLFEEQVTKTPDTVAVFCNDETLTYSQLNSRANQLAYTLRETGVRPDDLVMILSGRSVDMVTAIYAVMKSGAAYVPVDPDYPQDRIEYMIEDSKPKCIITVGVKMPVETDIRVIEISDDVYTGVAENPEKVNKPTDLAYVIYTSGTTGKPKGVMVEHHGVVNLWNYHKNHLALNETDRVMMFANYVFDGSVWEMLFAFANGVTLYIPSNEIIESTELMKEYLKKHKITVSYFPPAYYDIGNFEIDTWVVTAGSSASRTVIKNVLKHCGYINSYGPTETTVCATNWICPKGTSFGDETITIGSPIDNAQVYILSGTSLCGIGIPGELCVAGEGLARGYLNKPELTAEKFIDNPFGEGKLYRTGDLARWLPDGNIEYLGRIDEQVKIHGFRIELGEIESVLRTLNEIKDCAVIAKNDASGEKAIYAYLVSDEEISLSIVRDRRSDVLPEYMIPSYMGQIKAIPVTKNGKLDKRALPELVGSSDSEYIAPRSETEEIVCAAFAEILGVEKVGIRDNFFEMGGHSLRATRLVNAIEAKIGHRVALKDVFVSPTPEKLAQIITGDVIEDYTPIPKAEGKEYYPMSSTQKRTYLICQLDTDSVVYNMPQSLKLTGNVSPDKIRAVLQTLVDRHEILRTQFMMVNGEPVQKIMACVQADFEYVESSSAADSDLIRDFVRPFDLSAPPLVRARLVKRADYFLLMFDMHHIVGDGMSMGTFTREFAALYAGECLPPLTHQYKDYSEWMAQRDISSQKEYWVSQFGDEIPVLDMPTDFVRPQEQSFNGTMIFKSTGKVLGDKIKSAVTKSGATDYMLMLSALMVTLSKYSRQEDIVIGSPISGRTHKDTESMLGMFVNTLAMRGKPEKTKTFAQFLDEIKEVCLKAYENQEYPFEELVEAVEVKRDLSRNPLFDVMLVMQNNEQVVLKKDDIGIETLQLDSENSKFDFSFNIAAADDGYQLGLEYRTDLFNAETIARLLKHYVETLRQVIC
ncbi:MAG: amino acid adenylation domain-containing protein, partial [Clostridia bacterium]|nr:amino acid adenylation domain-containing protein [Clostridia bacterium]